MVSLITRHGDIACGDVIELICQESSDQCKTSRPGAFAYLQKALRPRRVLAAAPADKTVNASSYFVYE